MPERAGKLSVVGAILAALAASACCLGPVVLAAIGIGGIGAASAAGAYRPYWLAATVVLLGAGYYFTYRKQRHAEGCGCDQPRTRGAGRLALWIATAIVVLVAASPSLLAGLAHARGEATTVQNLSKTVLHVPGADCEGCLGPMRKALTKIGGVHDVRLDVDERTVAVTYEPAPGRVDAYVTAIRDLGYEVTSRTGSER